MMVTMFITSEMSKVIAIEIVMIFTTIVTTRIAKMITKGWLGLVQVNGTSEERLLAQLSALQLAVSQGSTNTVMVFLQFCWFSSWFASDDGLVFLRFWSLSWWWYSPDDRDMQVRHIASEGLDLGLPLRGQTALALAVSLGKVEEIFGGQDIWWRKYLAEKIFDWEIIWASWI